MTLATTDIAPDTRAFRGSLPLWAGVVMLVVADQRAQDRARPE